MRKIISVALIFPFSLSVVGQPLVKNKGKMHINQGTTLYISGNYIADGNSQIDQKGNTILVGDFVNNVTEGNLFSATSDGVFEFKGTATQTILGAASKSTNYIAFPNVKINNPTTVSLSQNMGMDTKDLTLEKGVFILKSAVDGDIKTSGYTQNAHLRVLGEIKTQREKGKGLIEVELALGENHKRGNLIGFTPPFKEIYSDYFTFNYISRPTKEGLFGESYSLITDPRTILYSGQGYILGLGIINKTEHPEYFDDLHEAWGGHVPNYEDRQTEKIVFGREDAPASFSDFVKDMPNAYGGETLNTDDVKVHLKAGKGFYYLGNPFTAPLDLSSFVDELDNTTHNWGAKRSADGTADVRNRIYVMSGGVGKYNKDASYGKFSFSVSYLIAQKVGGTLNPDAIADESRLIAPMQMFIIYKDKDSAFDFNIPKSARMHGDVKFLKNRSTTAATKIVDELLIQSTDNTTGGYDRLCVVFRKDATLKSNDPYDAGKIFNRSKGVNQIYTKSSDNKDLTTNVISPKTAKLTMYLTPSTSAQKITLKAFRLETLESITYLELEDSKTGVKTDLLKNPEYTFTSSPTDKEDRFVLHFTKIITGIEDLEQDQSIAANYKLGILTIDNLKDEYLNSNLTVVDTRGTLIHNIKINDSPKMEIAKYLNTGVYLIRITGKVNKTIKILVTE